MNALMRSERYPAGLLCREGLALSALEAYVEIGFVEPVEIGGEWYFSRLISLGAEAGYTFGIGRFGLRETNYLTDVQGADGVIALKTPLQRDPRGRLRYLRQDGSDYENVTLRLDGWRLMLRLGVHF